MNSKSLEQARNLVKASYISQGEQALNGRRKQVGYTMLEDVNGCMAELPVWLSPSDVLIYCCRLPQHNTAVRYCITSPLFGCLDQLSFFTWPAKKCITDRSPFPPPAFSIVVRSCITKNPKPPSSRDSPKPKA